MTSLVRFGHDASLELAEAAGWYERRRRGLGLDFLAQVDDAVGRISANPQAGSSVPGVAAADVRRMFVRRFPYHVVYLDLPDVVEVLAVAHDRRRPGYWASRTEG